MCQEILKIILVVTTHIYMFLYFTNYWMGVPVV